MDTGVWVQIWNLTVHISNGANIVWKDTNRTILPPAMSKIVGLTGFFNLDMANGQGEENPWINSCETQLKNWPCVTSYSCSRVG